MRSLEAIETLDVWITPIESLDVWIFHSYRVSKIGRFAVEPPPI